MDLSISEELYLFSQELHRYMSPQALEQLAKEIGFVQRKSKYRAQDLVALCVCLSQKVAHTSLIQLCSCLESSTGVLISPEGLNQRFNPSAVKILRHVSNIHFECRKFRRKNSILLHLFFSVLLP